MPALIPSRRAARAALAAGALLLSSSAGASSVCYLLGNVGVSFGAYDVFSPTPLDSAGSVTFQCDSLGPFGTVAIDLGTGSSGSYAPRRLQSGANTLDYNLYLDAARTTVWGDGFGGTSRYGPMTPATGTPITVWIYGRIPAGKSPAIGAYTDTIVVTLTF